jgi:outer membrane translocation and assembly module TamA
MKIMVAHRGQHYQHELVETYALSMVRTLRRMGHEVIEVPKGRLKDDSAYKRVDLLLDIGLGS